MKFYEYFERSSEVKKAAHILLLVGEDVIFKDVIVEDLAKLVNLWEVRERVEVGDIKSVINLWSEGSLMGARFLDVRVKAKPKNNKLWSSFLSKVSSSENYMTVSFLGEEPDFSKILSRSIFQVIECDFPKNIKSKIKITDLRLRSKGCTSLSKELVKELAGRVKSSVNLESAVITLSLLEKTLQKITEREITYVVGEQENFRNTSRAILSGNKVVLTQEVDELEPIFLLSTWFSILKKFYCWMSEEEGKKEGKNKEWESVEEVDREDGDVKSKVNKYQLRDYKVARQRYSQRLVRDILEDINQVYQDIRIGNKDGWEERVRLIINKMA